MTWDTISFIQSSMITICSMACVHVFLYVKKSLPKDIRRLFFLLSEVLMLECLEVYFDNRLALWPDNTYYYWRMIVSTIGYTLRPLMLYIVVLITTRNVRWKAKEIVLAIPTIATLGISLLAFFTKWVFWYDETNQFHGAPLRWFFFVALIIYFLIILLNAIANYKKQGNEIFVIIGILFLLSFDMIWSMNHKNISIHLELESLSVILYFMYFLSIFHAKEIEEKDEEIIDSEQRLTKIMLDQSIETLAYTIDAKDKYTKGHSSRVAKYARMIASLGGKSDEECREVYLAGLLHDIGKISVSDSIINKTSKLTDEEFEKIKKHPSNGAIILKKMKSIPYLQDGALYHHERYDGKGYPNGLAGNEIPELARIISVADAYDAMTSYRSYRPTMDQSVVKQEIWKGIGTQFDPHFAKMMISLIDADVYYEMREILGEQDEIAFDYDDIKVEWNTTPKEQTADTNMMQQTDISLLATFIVSEEHWFDPSDGIRVTDSTRRVSFHSSTRKEAKYVWSAPVVLVFSSDDGKVLGPNYEELGVFMCAGYGWRAGSSLYEHSEFTKNEAFGSWDNWIDRNKSGLDYTMDVFVNENIVTMIINNDLLRMNIELALSEDYSKNIYVAISGERSDISEIHVI